MGTRTKFYRYQQQMAKMSESSALKHHPPSEGELAECATQPKFTLAYVEYKSACKT